MRMSRPLLHRRSCGTAIAMRLETADELHDELRERAL